MKCIVTGGSGFIGNHLVQKLLDAGHEVSVLDLRKPKVDVRWLEIDIRSADAIDLQGFEVVYHLAAISNARRCSDLPHDCYSTDVIGTHNVVSAAARDDVDRVILASSSWVAGAQNRDIIKEDSLFNLQSINTVYGASKIS